MGELASTAWGRLLGARKARQAERISNHREVVKLLEFRGRASAGNRPDMVRFVDQLLKLYSEQNRMLTEKDNSDLSQVLSPYMFVLNDSLSNTDALGAMSKNECRALFASCVILCSTLSGGTAIAICGLACGFAYESCIENCSGTPIGGSVTASAGGTGGGGVMGSGP